MAGEMAAAVEEEAPETTARRRRTPPLDEETRAIAVISESLSELNPEACSRVVMYMGMRWPRPQSAALAPMPPGFLRE